MLSDRVKMRSASILRAEFAEKIQKIRLNRVFMRFERVLMNEIVAFFERMENVIEDYPDVYFKIERLRHNGWWRIHVFGRNMAAVGDAELLFAENRDREDAFMSALNQIDQLRTNIENLKGEKDERINRKLQVLRSELANRGTR